MKKKKKLPEIIITGTPQELVEIEPLLVMAGYNDGVGIWGKLEECKRIIGYGDAGLVYSRAFIPVRQRPTFNAYETHKILHYIETGEIKEHIHDKIDTEWLKKSLEYASSILKKPRKPSLKLTDAYSGKILYNKTQTHTGQTKVVGNRTSTHPVIPKYSVVKDLIKKSKLRDWKLVEKAFKRWANPDNKNCISYYSPTSQLELLSFFKKHFTK